MHLTHVALWVRDLEGMRDFYVAHLGATAGNIYINPQRGFRSCFVGFAQGPRLELMTLPTLADRLPGPTPAGYAHLALPVGSEAEVDTLTGRLASLGFPPVSGPRRTGDGYYESVIEDPEGNLIEITV